jgi:tetratricopeptide (TPR) repeat protein
MAFEPTLHIEDHLDQPDCTHQANPGTRDFVDALNEHARALASTNPACAQEICQRALRASSDLSYREGEARALTLLAWLNFVHGQLDLALTRALNAEAVARMAHDPRLEGHALYVVALIQDQAGNFAEAMKAHQKTIAIARELGDLSLEANGFLAMGLQHSHQGEHNKALDCFVRAFNFYRQIEADDDRQAMALNNIAFALTEMGDVLRALNYAQQALSKCPPDNLRTYSQILQTTGKVYVAMGQLDEALERFMEALEMASEATTSGQTTEREFEASLHHDIAHMHRVMNQHQPAFVALQHALEIAQAIDAKSLLIDIHDQFSKTYRATNQIALSLAHAEQRESVRASLRQVTTERQEKVTRLITILQASRTHIRQEQCQAAQDWLWRACLNGNAPTC